MRHKNSSEISLRANNRPQELTLTNFPVGNNKFSPHVKGHNKIRIFSAKWHATHVKGFVHFKSFKFTFDNHVKLDFEFFLFREKK